MRNPAAAEKETGMKYSNASLIKQAESQIAVLEAEIREAEATFEKDLKKWRAECLADAKKYLADITAWQIAPHNAPRPDNRHAYGPQRHAYAGYGEDGTIGGRVKKLKQFILQIKLCGEDMIEFKNSYDKQMLDILTK